MHLKLLAGFSNLAPHHVKRGARKFSFAAAFAKLVCGALRCHSIAVAPVDWAGKFSVAGKRAPCGLPTPCSKKKNHANIAPEALSSGLVGGWPSWEARRSGEHHAKPGVLAAVPVRKSSVAV